MKKSLKIISNRFFDNKYPINTDIDDAKIILISEGLKYIINILSEIFI